jgi:hypothetical protein
MLLRKPGFGIVSFLAGRFITSCGEWRRAPICRNLKLLSPAKAFATRIPLWLFTLSRLDKFAQGRKGSPMDRLDEAMWLIEGLLAKFQRSTSPEPIQVCVVEILIGVACYGDGSSTIAGYFRQWVRMSSPWMRNSNF